MDKTLKRLYLRPWNIYQEKYLFFMMVNEGIENSTAITSEEIDRCIAILAQLNTNTDQIFDIPKEQRIALIKEAGMFPDQTGMSFPEELKMVYRQQNGKRKRRIKQPVRKRE